MKIRCLKSDLVKGVSIVSKAVPTKTTMPILECILIDATTDIIKLTANDMELGIETVIRGQIDEKGMIALDARIFSDIVRKLPDNEIVIESEANLQTLITCEKAKFNISGKSGEDFSYLPYIERENPVVISQFTLKEVIRQTIFSIADNDSNKLMTGELFDMNGDLLKVVSLDGHRISIRKIELKESYEPKKIVVPGKTLIEVSKILSGEADSEVRLYFTANHIVFEFDDTTEVEDIIYEDDLNEDESEDKSKKDNKQKRAKKKKVTKTKRKNKTKVKTKVKKEKRGRSVFSTLIIFLLILIVIAGICVGGYFAYEYYQDQQAQINDLQERLDESNKNEDNDKESQKPSETDDKNKATDKKTDESDRTNESNDKPIEDNGTEDSNDIPLDEGDVNTGNESNQ